jgi:hypothetical protein
MCCRSKKKYAKEVYDSFNDTESQIFYKVVLKETKLNSNTKSVTKSVALTGLYRYGFKYNIGTNISNSVETYRNRYKDRRIDQGIHVYRTIATAQKIQEKNYGSILIEVSCKRCDLIGADNESAVFTKVHIPKSEFMKALDAK